MQGVADIDLWPAVGLLGCWTWAQFQRWLRGCLAVSCRQARGPRFPPCVPSPVRHSTLWMHANQEQLPGAGAWREDSCGGCLARLRGRHPGRPVLSLKQDLGTALNPISLACRAAVVWRWPQRGGLSTEWQRPHPGPSMAPALGYMAFPGHPLREVP